ncbi:hypothetical protein P280DRAFT_363089, partial [Massarina eburnea CBS 473.64]
PRPPRQRLSSINNPNAGSSSRGDQPSPPTAAPAPTKKDCCDRPDPSEDEDGRMVCENCGRVIAQNNFSSELTFGENAAGGATVVGGLIGDSQRFANSMGGTMRGMGSNMDSRQKTVQNGATEIQKLTTELNLPERIKVHANTWYKLALNHNFVQGRRIKHVAAVAIYLAARKQPDNTLLLIDLSERVVANVWDLGKTYKEFCKTIMETDPTQVDGKMTVQQIEPLMLKFCQRLEFGSDSHRVANDAIQLLQSMKRDWMVQGRNPAGLCGACIIMAARMNNFRRTIREVVYVVKVADTTITQRLYEYKRTASSNLTVDQFRKYGDKMKPMSQPPAVWRREEKERRAEKRKAGAAGISEENSSSSEFEGDTGDSLLPGSSNAEQPETRASKKQGLSKGKARVPHDNDSASAIDVDAVAVNEDLETIAARAEGLIEDDDVVIPLPLKKRGRSKKKATPVIVPDEDLEVEQELEREIAGTVENWHSIFKEFETNSEHWILVQAANRARDLVTEHMPNGNINSDEIIGEHEFDDDPEVANSTLSKEEVVAKELVWVAANEDWLREEQRKILTKALEEAQGKPAKPKQRRQRHQMGDGSVLGPDGAANAADSAYKMVVKRGGKAFSSALDYERIKGLFNGGQSPSTQVPTPEGSATAGASPPANETAQQASPTRVVEMVDEDMEEEEVEEEPEVEEYEEDLEHEHDYEDEEGFGNETYDDY